MSEFKGTKGKWLIHKRAPVKNDLGIFHKPIYSGVNVENIACEAFNKELIACEANAKLISKAPEMLEMLKRCEVRIEPKDIHISLLNDLRQLIKEATE
ncbi:hypothetical protein HZP13_14550 [Elizabethkingia anophelis]|nr:hypothetical protein [Elizabethkingia anophelis]